MGVSHLFAALLAAGAASPQAPSLELLIPAYFYPTSWTPENYYWDELRAAAKSGVPMTVIMNPANGHEPMDPTYLTELKELKKIKSESGRSASVIAYISTCWATSPCKQGAPPAQPGTDEFEQALARIASEIDIYASYYETDGHTLQGVFLDEMSTQASALPFYERVATHVRTNHPGWTIVGNPGTEGETASDYLAVANILVTFEGTYRMYDNRDVDSVVPADRQAHIITNTYSAQQMTDLVNGARGNASYIYVTDQFQPTQDEEDKTAPAGQDDKPYNQLPSYWDVELTEVSK